MPSLTIECLATEGPQFNAAIEQYNRFVQTEASTSAMPHKATEVKLISQEQKRDNYLEFTLEYENPLALLLLGYGFGLLVVEDEQQPGLRREAPV